MSKYLFTMLNSNDLGLLARSLPIANELRKQGHQVVFCNPASSPSRLIAEAGFENLLPSGFPYYMISTDINPQSLSLLFHSGHVKRDLGILVSVVSHMLRLGTDEIWNIDHFLYLNGMFSEAFVRANVEAVFELISACEPDAVVDFWNPFACIAARVKRKLLITVIQADMHPESKGFMWWKQPPEGLPFSVVPTNRVLAGFHHPPIDRIADLFVGDKTLVVGLPETDPLPETAEVTYIGPILWQKEGEPLPERVANLSREQPLVWLYPGKLQYVRGVDSPFDSEVVLKACIEALGNQPVQVVLTSGYHALPGKFAALPANFLFEPYVPGLAMAERSDLLIHHGGYGSCQTGLFAGRPALIIPTYSERESNARRIAAQGAGEIILPEADAKGTKKRVPAEEVRRKVFNILEDESFTLNAQRIRARMRSYGGACEAARLIESFTRGWRRISLPF